MLVGVSLFGFTGLALAQSSMTHDAMQKTTRPSSMTMHPPAPMILTISASGEGRIRGVVTSVGANTLTIASWGGVWTITISNATIILPKNDFSKIAVGDYVGASGMVSEDGPTMAAEYLRNWTTKREAMMKEDRMMATSSASMVH